jgi:hypothetical protein
MKSFFLIALSSNFDHLQVPIGDWMTRGLGSLEDWKFKYTLLEFGLLLFEGFD